MKRFKGLGIVGDVLTPSVINAIKLGAIAGVGAEVAEQATDWVKKTIWKDEATAPKEDSYWQMALEMGVGLIGAYLVLKMTKDRNISTAIVTGVTAKQAIKLVKNVMKEIGGNSVQGWGRIGSLVRDDLPAGSSDYLGGLVRDNLPITGLGNSGGGNFGVQFNAA